VPCYHQKPTSRSVGYTGIAAGIGYRNGAPDTYRTRDPFTRAKKPA
jgi:hypothetical protein